MGLDMYISKSKDAEVDGMGFGTPDDTEELHYFRKFNALHSYFADKYLELHPNLNASDFNCINVEITKEMLEEIEQGFSEESILPRSGFFFGDTSRVFPYHLIELGKMIIKAEQAFDEGYKVFYSSWW